MEEDIQHSNISEEEMGALHSLHLAENAIARVRAKITQGISRIDCVDCGDKIPLARRNAVQGCLRCVQCQGLYEHQKDH